jgi:FtsP/CotA-like multicopper oxidase with cupredoxin domain
VAATETRTRSRSRVTIAVVVGLAVVLLASLLLRDGPSAGEVDADGRLTLTVEDYRFDVDTWRLPVGEPVELVFVNLDEVSHPLSLGRELVVEGAGRLPTGYAEDLLAGLPASSAPATALTEAPDGSTTLQLLGGRTVTLQVTFPPDKAGTWYAGCFTGGGCHRVAGVEATLEIGQ